jgi:phosphatidylserine/phosphatidylglycerophosphate/cardiolipin synthase-like enzyme
MKVKIQSSVVRLLIGSCLFASVAQAAAPAQGFYENSTSTPLIALLDSAQSTIDIEIYTMNDPIAQRAVLNALAAHVRVRIIQEPTPVGAPCKVFDPSTSADNASCTALKLFKAKVLAAGGMYVPFTKNLCGSGIYGCVEHGKMVLVDGKIAMLSTGNFDSTNLCDMSASPSRCNRDYSYVIHYLPGVQVLGQVFERDLAAVPYDLSAILGRSGAADLTISPLSMAPLIQFIRSAKTNLVLQNQYLDDPTMNAEIIAAARRGVDVRINTSSACAFGAPTASNGARWTQIYQAFDAAGVKSRIFTKNVKVGGNFGYLHAKTIVVDGTTAWVGSVNGSTQALSSNREFGVFFNAPKDVASLLSYMKSDFNNPASESWQDSLLCKNDR